MEQSALNHSQVTGEFRFPLSHNPFYFPVSLRLLSTRPPRVQPLAHRLWSHQTAESLHRANIDWIDLVWFGWQILNIKKLRSGSTTQCWNKRVTSNPWAQEACSIIVHGNHKYSWSIFTMHKLNFTSTRSSNKMLSDNNSSSIKMV